jgi:hypothetical protein
MVSVPLADLILVLRDAGSNPYAEHFAAQANVEAIVEAVQKDQPPAVTS